MVNFFVAVHRRHKLICVVVAGIASPMSPTHDLFSPLPATTRFIDDGPTNQPTNHSTSSVAFYPRTKMTKKHFSSFEGEEKVFFFS